jgi:hypothetical protein
MDGSLLGSFEALLQTATLPDLGPGPRAGVRPLPQLQAELENFFQRNSLTSPRATALHAAALLWHDYLDESHRLSQDLPDANGSYLHGIMHRREPDYSNAKYWFRRVGHHPVYAELSQTAGELLRKSDPEGALRDRLLPDGRWEPFAFIDLCEESATGAVPTQQRQVLIELQAMEFHGLLAHL